MMGRLQEPATKLLMFADCSYPEYAAIYKQLKKRFKQLTQLLVPHWPVDDEIGGENVILQERHGNQILRLVYGLYRHFNFHG